MQAIFFSSLRPYLLRGPPIFLSSLCLGQLPKGRSYWGMKPYIIEIHRDQKFNSIHHYLFMRHMSIDGCTNATLPDDNVQLQRLFRVPEWKEQTHNKLTSCSRIHLEKMTFSHNHNRIQKSSSTHMNCVTFRNTLFSLRWLILFPSELPIWRITPCRLSETDYSIYSQLRSPSGGNILHS
jgi:hypothetical protein